MRIKAATTCLAVVLMVAAATVAAGATPTNESAGGATDVGVTADEIRIGVIADTGSALAPGLFQGSVDAVQAWAEWMNKKNGGLAGREIVVDVYDSGLDANKARNAIIEACQKDFALVGTSAIFVFNADDLVNCADASGARTGLPDFPVLTTEVEHQCSPVSFPINPPILDCATADQNPQTYRGSLNATPYLLKRFGKNALHGVYVYPSDLKASKDAWIPQYTAYQDAGIREDASFDLSARAPQSAYTPIIQAIRDAGSTYVTQGGPATIQVSLMKEAKIQGVNSVEAWVCTLQCYDDVVVDAPETEGLFVSLLFLPFEEAKQNAMLRTFLKSVGADNADGFAAQAWAAAVLFGESVEKAVADGGDAALTRAAVLDAVGTTTEFNADGMIGTINPAEKVPSQCVIVTQVRSGEFVRVFPKKKGTFDCSDKNSFEVQMNLE